MSKITDFNFTHSGRRYELEFDLNDAEIVNDKLSIDVTSRVTFLHEINNTSVNKSHESITLKVEVDYANDRIKILHDELILFERSFSQMEELQQAEDNAHFTTEEKPSLVKTPDPIHDQVTEDISGYVEELISTMPAGDPIFGCLIKAGASTVIGQALKCNHVVKARPDAELQSWNTTRQIYSVARCMSREGIGMAWKCSWRTARCMATLGLM